MNIPVDQLAVGNDFPSTNNFSFSSRIMCDKSSGRLDGQRYIFMSDLNPVFESNGPPALSVVDEELIKRLRDRLSSNHLGKGQNILWSDGSVQYIKVRSIQGDDIYTIKGIVIYEGREVPCEPEDTFLAP